MTRATVRTASAGIVVLGALLAGCGKYGPPVRTKPVPAATPPAATEPSPTPAAAPDEGSSGVPATPTAPTTPDDEEERTP